MKIKTLEQRNKLIDLLVKAHFNEMDNDDLKRYYFDTKTLDMQGWSDAELDAVAKDFEVKL